MHTYLLSIIAFRYIPNSVIARPVSAVWMTAVQHPWYKLPYRARLAIGWLILLGTVLGSAFGLPLQPVGYLTLFLIIQSDPFFQGTTFGDRAINVIGLLSFQVGFYITSKNRAVIPW
jgi:concentrative nucleoside transporter, CNT family